MKIVGQVEDNGCIDFGNWHMAVDNAIEPHASIEVDDTVWTRYYELRERLYAIEEGFQGTWDQKFRRPWTPSESFRNLMDACDDAMEGRTP